MLWKTLCTQNLGFRTLVIGNWNSTSLVGKDHQLVEVGKQYSLDDVGI